MIFTPEQANHPSIKLFIRCRRYIRKAFEARCRFDDERNAYRRIAAILAERGNPFDTHRITKFNSLQDECAADLNTMEDTVNPLVNQVYEAMESASAILSPLQRAQLVGVSTSWLEARNPHWETLSLFEMYFDLLAESDKNIGHDNMPMFWFCGQMVSLSSAIFYRYVLSTSESRIEKILPKKHLSLVR
jgi:hypothetical protein